jgi:hypothetical protein
MSTIKTSIFIRAHRILAKLDSYYDLSGDRKLPAGMPSMPALSAKERSIGYYINDPISFSSLLLFTSLAIYVYTGKQWDRVMLREIDHAIAPWSKDHVQGFALALRDGRKLWLPVAGNRAEKYFDAFEVLRYIDRVIADLE